MSSEGPIIRLSRPLRAVRTGARPPLESAAAPQPAAPDTAHVAELHRKLAHEREQRARGEAELARRQAQLAEKEKALDERMAQLARLVSSVEQEKVGLLQANEEEIVSFSLSITEKVLQYEIENGRYKIGEVVSSTLRAVRDKGAVVVRVNPRDLEMTRAALATMAEGAGPGRASAVADESIPLASCCIETDSGKVFSEIPGRLKRIEQSLLKKNGEANGV
jgi:flagellar biosynthesis/type III secretory pathway protein FliH